MKLQMQVVGVGAAANAAFLARLREQAARRSLARRREDARRRFTAIFGPEPVEQTTE